MARAGRKRKQGKRHPSGDLVRQRVDRGTAEGRLQRARGCGQLDPQVSLLWLQGRAEEAIGSVANDHGEGRDAIGRAWLAGLLEYEGKDPAALLLAGRKLHHLYWDYFYQLNSASATYEPKVRSMASGFERDRMIDEQLNARNAVLDRLDRETRGVRKAVYAICVDHHYDFGPEWLDRLIALRSAGSRYAETSDWAMMRLALKGLGELA